ncbi:MAG: RNA polymerase factor sigma-54 [Armatimonadetes bacterium]|nr:RNA polymerase factor sigma-54 [Armatimonadota bacterium]
MRQGLRQSTGIKQSANLKVDPKIVLGSQLLQMSQFELEKTIESELIENPALERIDDYEEPLMTEEILKAIAPAELKPTSENYEAKRSLPQDSSDNLDWLDFASCDDSLWDHLMAQLRPVVPAELWEVAIYLIGSVNDRGYLTCTVEDAALDCDVALEDAEMVWQELRECEPAGVGAEDLRDCLILQLRDAQSDEERLARLILKRNWDELVSRNKKALAKTYEAEEELIEAAFEEILSLNPFPGETFSRAKTTKASDKPIPAKPDVIITLDEIGWIVEVPGPSTINLRVSRAYEDRKKVLAEKSTADAAEKRHINEFMDRAGRFLDALTQRRQQLARLGKYLVENQSGFVKTGEYKFLLPMTRSQIAKELGVHESTISRATSGKFIQLANEEVVPFEVFFKPALRVQKMIEEILETENPDNPLSDERIAAMLAEKGVKIARRTVNKYRDRNKLLSSRLRKTG